jgi:hypothetical protein
MDREFSISYRSPSSFPRKRESKGGKGRSSCLWTPAFAGVTITNCDAGLHFEPGSQTQT